MENGELSNHSVRIDNEQQLLERLKDTTMILTDDNQSISKETKNILNITKKMLSYLKNPQLQNDLFLEDIQNFDISSFYSKFVDQEEISTNNDITDKSNLYAIILYLFLLISDDKFISQDINNDINSSKIIKFTKNDIEELYRSLSSYLNLDTDNMPSFDSIFDSLSSIIPKIDTNKLEEYKKMLMQEEEDTNKKDDPDLNEKKFLAYDSFFDESNKEIDQIIKDIDKITEARKNKKVEIKKVEFKKIEEQNFIVTEKAKENIQSCSQYIELGIPVLLEGETGTSKTLTAETVCDLYGYEIIRFNLSSETRITDLFGRHFGDENSWSGISYQDGPFFRAFSEGKVFLLDEINLASASVLQCLEEALDSGYLSVEIPGKPLKKRIKMNPNFKLIATQNPNKGSYANKRQNLGQKFYSRFQIINFPQFKENELLDIAQGLAKRFGYNDSKCITSLISFHKKWSEQSDDIQCFTIREIAATIKALSEKESVYDTIMTIYGARYEKQTKNKLINFLKENYPDLCKDSKEPDCPNFEGCYMNKSLKSVIKSVLFSLNNGRNVIITGKKGCGKTQVAIWISEYYNKKIKTKKTDENKSFFCFCSEEIKVADLIGYQAPSGNSDGTNELIKWQDGFLTIALINGKCAVLESLDEAPPTVTERLNGLLDKKYDKKEKYFDIPENSSCPKVKIEDSFRILGTSDIDKIQQMSQAFLNRFDIIVLENQMDDITEQQFKELITTLMNKHSSNLKEEIKSNDDSNQVQQIKEYNINDNIVNLIYEKVKDDRNISHISKICNSIIKLSFYFKKNANIAENDVVGFTFNILFNKDYFEIPELIQAELLNGLKSFNKKFDLKDNSNNNDESDGNIAGYSAADNTDDPFFFEDSPCLCNFIAKLHAYSIIQQPLCVIGPTGVGKTSAARAFARMRKIKSKSNSSFQMHSFHSGTKVSHFFGSTTLQNGKIVFHDGTLTDALKNGLVFIADEFNLSSTSVMKSISLALDPTIGKNVFIPGIGEIINIYPGFHFIACQNELGTLGRNAIPDTIASRFVEIVYPTPKESEIEDICVNIYRENFTDKKTFEKEDEIFARNASKFMMKLNEEIKAKSNLFYISPWSLRDISKLFRRIYTQNDNNVINILPIHHTLFYTMSVVPPKFEDKVIDDVFNIIKQTFDSCKSSFDDCIECFKSKPIIVTEGENKGFIMKGKSGIRFDKYEKLKDKCLPSLLNAIFKISLSNKREPLLIMGNSGYKTFLAQLFLPRAQIIILNQETNVGQLLGSSGFMTKVEAKIFYIESICKILRNDIESIRLKKYFEEGKLIEDDVYKLILEGKKGTIPTSFYYALDNFHEKLFQEQEDNGVLSNTVLEFRPGLFLNAILQGQSLILKDLPNLPTIVLERFNELFSGKQNITLAEDIHDSFTPPYDKELTNFNDYFRVLALGPENTSSKLSEAVLSRFTSVAVSEYSSDEQVDVLKSYIEINDLKFNHDLNELNEFASINFSGIGLHITFPQLIKIVEITSKLDQQTSANLDQNYNLEMTLYRVLGGMLESNQRKNFLLTKIQNTFKTPEIYNYNFKQENEPICSLVVDKIQNNKGVKSLISNLFINCSIAKECELNVAYTDSFNDLLDILHMGLLIHNPVILEGPPGQGKHTAIYYIAEMLDMEVTRISISQSTKVEDLFGKDSIVSKPDGIHIEMRETDFIKIIKSSTNFQKRSLIILENINAASQAILNALVPVFSSHSTSILLPNGSTIQKGTFDIIGIFNPQISSKDKLPSLINSSIYHIVSKPTPDEVSEIILNKFESAGLSADEALNFNAYYHNAKLIASSQGYSSEMFTLNDIGKYILFRNKTLKVFDEKTIVQMIFAYRFSSDKMVEKIIKDLNLEVMKFQPLFGYNGQKTELFIKLSNDDAEQISLPLFKPPKNISKISAIESLTLPQKHCLIFTAISILTNRACVIQGDTASGKSYIIYLISKLVGAKLNVIQMNADCNLAMLAGQSVLNNKLTANDKIYLRKIFKEICINNKIKEYINNNIKNEKALTPKALKKLISFVQNLLPEIRGEIYYPEIEMSLFIMKRIMSPVNRFKQDSSTFINAIKNGEWVLIDGIESAPPTVAEKLSSLCGDNPELNLYEFGPEFYFSTDKIHKNFRLFITYNPSGVKESQMIDLTFLVKSMTFTLPPIDDTEESSAQVLLGSLITHNFEPTLSKQLAARFAHMHVKAKIKSQANPENYAGDKQYNGRTLKFIIQALSQEKDKKNISELICFIIESFYLKSFVKTDKSDEFLLSCINDFKEQPSDKLLDYLFLSDNDPRKRNKEVLIVLRNIQKHVLGSINSYVLNLQDFFNSCSYITIYDLQYIANHFRITKKLIKLHSDINDPNKNYLLNYCSLFSLSSIFEQITDPNSIIIKEHTFLYLNDHDLKNNESITLPLLQFDLLRYLANNNIFSENCSFLFENQTNQNLLSKVYDIVIKNSKQSVIELYSLIQQDYKSIDFVMKIFPFSKIKLSSLSMICYWLPLSKILIEKGVHFSYTIDNQKLTFNDKPAACTFSADLIMNEKDSFSLSKNSVIYYDRNKEKLVLYSNYEDKLYYSIISTLAKNPDENISKYRMDSLKYNYRNKYIENEHLNSILSMKEIFDKQDYPLIGLIWNLIYTLPEIVIKQLSNLVNTIESELLLFHFNSFKSMNLDNFNDIIELTKWAKLFDSKTTLLRSIISDSDFNSKNKNTEATINKIEDEIRYFKGAPKSLNNFWSSDILMKSYQQKLDEYVKIQENEEMKSQELTNKRTIKNLREQLYYQKVSDEFKQMKNDLIDQLDSISVFSDEICKSAKKIVDQFIDYSSSREVNNDKIVWPDIFPNKTFSSNSSYNNNFHSENIKLFEELIWYSKVRSLLNAIEKGQNVLNNVNKLNDFQEMSCLKVIFLDRLIKNPESNKINDDNASNVLNAHMIYKLNSINSAFLSQPDLIYEIINSYMNRYTKTDEEYRWAYSNKHPSDILLSIPEFKPKDIIFLVINEKSDGAFCNGPLLKYVHNDYFLRNIKDLLHEKYTSFFDAVCAIAQKAYSLWVNKKDNVKFENFNELKKAYDDIKMYDIYYENDKKVLYEIKKLITIAENLSKSNNSNSKLLYDDAFLLTESWMKNQQIKRFPSLIFWICKNQNCANQIFEKNKKLLNENNQNYPGIPLWLICLRIVSSIDGVLFDSKSSSQISQTVKDAINDKVINHLSKIGQNSSFDWINLLISSIPTQFANTSIKMIHDFYILLADDYFYNQSKVANEIKEQLIYDAVSKTTELVLSNKSQELLSHDISDEQSYTNFLSYPSDFIKSRIKKRITDAHKGVLENETTKNLISLLSEINSINEIVEHIKISIFKEEKEREEQCKKISEENYKQDISSKHISIKKYINDYNKIVDFLKNYKSKKRDHDETTKYLIDIQKNLSIYNEIFKDEGFNLQLIKYSTYKEEKVQLRKYNDNYSLGLPNTNNQQIFHYLLPDEYLTRDYHYYFTCYVYGTNYIHYIKEKYDEKCQNIEKYDTEIKQIVMNHTIKSTKIPKLFFGDKSINSEEFTFLLNMLIKNLNKFNEKYIIPLQSNKITMDSIYFLDEIRSDIKNVLKCLKAKFSDDSPTDINNILQGPINEKLSNLLPLIDDLINLTRTDILPILSNMNEFKDDSRLFYADFNIQKPNFNENPQWKPSFSSIEKIESLSSPVISISQDKRLIKSVNALICPIGPIIPSQYTEPISINIISFINDEVFCEIKDISDPDFNSWISTNEKVKNFEPIQIFITPHPIASHEQITKKIEGNLLIKTKATEPLTLPFKLYLGIVPLQIKLTCREYKLAEENNILKLCTDNIESESKITFEIKNYYIHNSFIIAVDLESFEDNEIEKPKYSTDPEKQELTISFPSVNDVPKKCHFYIKIAFSDNFVCKILCDALIIPFNASFEFYDFSAKEFREYKDKNFSVIFIQGTSQKQYLRIQSLYPSKKQGSLKFEFQCIEYDQSINEPFEIGENTIIPIELKKADDKISYGKVSLFIDGTYYKSIQFTFTTQPYFPNDSYSGKNYKKNNDEFLSKYPCEVYQNTTNKWTKIYDNNNLDKIYKSNLPFIAVTPFKYFTNNNFYEVKYNNGMVNVTTKRGKQNIIKYTQARIIKDAKDIFKIQDKFTETSEKNWLFKKDHTYFSIIGQISEEYWFPIFYDIPQNIYTESTLSLDEKNYQKAESNIKRFKNIILNTNADEKFKIIIECFNKRQISDLPVDKTNFAIFMAFLLDENTVDHIDKIISNMPKEIQNEFKDFKSEIAKAKKKVAKNKIKSINLIISHNLIIMFAKIFTEKYKEIESRDFKVDLPLGYDKIKEKRLEVFNKYYTYDQNKSQEKSKAFDKLPQNNEEIMKKINVLEIPENANNRFLIIKESSNIKATICESDSLGEFKFEKTNDEDSDKMNNDMENLSLPPIKKTNIYTIQSLCEFYSSCSQGAIILPTYIRYQYNKKSLDDAELFFGKLLNIYNDITKTHKTNKSIVSSYVNYFVESFKNCVKRLKKAGINIDYSYYSDSNDNKQNDKQEYIIYPSNYKPNLSVTEWENKTNTQNKKTNQRQAHDPKMAQTKLRTQNTDLSNPNKANPNFREGYSDRTKVRENMKKINDKLLETNPIDVHISDVGYNDSIGRSSSNRPVDSRRQKLKVDIDVKELRQVTSESVDGLFSNFNEIDGIDLMIRQIKRADKTQALTFYDKSECNIPEGYLYPTNIYNIKVIPIKELVDNCQYLIANLISKASESNCPFHDMYSNLLIDISSFISAENKIYNFMLLTSFSYALSALEIPFSIAIVADQKFRFVLKSFNEDISIFILQKVFDCLFIKRFRTNIADTCYYSIENMKYSDEARSQRSFFFFSNGIDENLVYAESWKEKILNDPNNSFGFIFTKSKHIVSENNTIIQGVWDEFNKVVYGSPSFAKIIYINSDINDNTIQAVTNLFKDTLDRNKKIVDKDNLNISNDHKPEFKEEFETLTKDEFESIKEDINFDFDDDSTSFFRQYNPKFNDVPTKFEKVDDKFYRNKTNKIVKTVLDPTIREEFVQFIHSILCANKFVFKPLLEFIFTPNLSTQKVLSRTGTEFDITALIFNLINPVPDPLIYLEQKGGLIRNYGISIVIDASRSCFNPLSACHSYKTIEILFSALSLIDVPCIDVIIATDNEPIVLCSEVPSMRLLNEKSQFWISLFKCLYNSSYDKCNLESAIHAAYDIRKIGYINPTCYMFVLTDGLYENEQKQVIKNHLMTCQHSGISIFGIGIGIYPRGIIDMFPNIIFATNPNYLIHGIASFFGNQTVESYNDSIKHLTPDPPKFETLSTVFKELNKFIEKPIFIDLKQHLAKTPHALGIKGNVSKLGANVTGVLRFSIQWNDIGDWDKNDLDAHCIEPNGHEIYYSDRIDENTGGNLDVDITDPKPNKPACENITWPDINKMLNGKYQFFVHQFAYRKGQSGFRAEIEFNGFSYFYDYKKPLDTNKEKVYVADVTLQDGHFKIHHKLDFY